MAEAILGEAVEIARLLVEMPDERHAVDGDAAGLEEAVTFEDGLLGFFEMFEDGSTERAVEGARLGGNCVGGAGEIDVRLAMRGGRVIDADVLGDEGSQ